MDVRWRRPAAVDVTLHVCCVAEGGVQGLPLFLKGVQKLSLFSWENSLDQDFPPGLGLEVGSQCGVRGGHGICESDRAAVSPGHTGQRGALVDFTGSFPNGIFLPDYLAHCFI